MTARSYKQYLAVAPYPTRSYSPEIGRRITRPSQACIQIWTLGPTREVFANQEEKNANDMERDQGQMRCEMVLCLSGGPAHEIRWCPLPSHDLVCPFLLRRVSLEFFILHHLQITDPSHAAGPRKLGVLAGTFEDGSLSIYVVPEPADLRSRDQDSSKPVFGMSSLETDTGNDQASKSAPPRTIYPNRTTGDHLLVLGLGQQRGSGRWLYEW